MILDGLGRSSEAIGSRWMVSEDLPTLSKPALNQILDSVGPHHPLATCGKRPSKTIQNLILIHELIRIRGVSESTPETRYIASKSLIKQ